MENDGTPIPDPSQPNLQKLSLVDPEEKTLAVKPPPDQSHVNSTGTQQHANTSAMSMRKSEESKQEDAMGNVSPEKSHHPKHQENTFLYLLVVSLFLSFCLDLLKNAIPLPSWLSFIAPFLIIVFVALLILVEAIKAHTPTDVIPRRAFLKYCALSSGTIALLTILSGFLLFEEINLKKTRENLAKEQDTFNTQRKTQLTKLRMGLTTGRPNPSTVRRFENAVSDILGIPVSSTFYPTYADTIKALGHGDVEIAWLGPLAYLRAHQIYGARAFIGNTNLNGKKTYNSYIIANAKANIHHLNDLKGKDFALADENSTSGMLIPLTELKQAGFNLETDIYTTFVGAQNVLSNVLNGTFPAGAISSDDYDDALRQSKFHEDDLVIITKSQDIPQGPFLARNDIHHYDELRIEDAFFTVQERSLPIIRTLGVGGFTKVEHKNYEFLIPLANNLGIDLSKPR